MALEDREYNSKVDKNLKIVRVKNTGLFAIKFVGGGGTPKELDGMFTSPSLAEVAIKKYMDNPAPKRANKKEVSSG